MKKLLISAMVLGVIAMVAAAVRTTEATATVSVVDIYGAPLHDGDLISANQNAGDPDIFIIKIKPFDGYNGVKRLFLNPAIFGMYAHLGGFERVRQVSFAIRESFVTSGLFRNCESSDQKVWATEVTGEDDGILHHVQMTGDQAVSEDAHFFDKVFCINNREDAFYVRSIYPYTHLAEVPRYYRGPLGCMVRPPCLDSEPSCLMPEPSSGWCPTPTPTPTYAPSPQPMIISRPSCAIPPWCLGVTTYCATQQLPSGIGFCQKASTYNIGSAVGVAGASLTTNGENATLIASLTMPQCYALRDAFLTWQTTALNLDIDQRYDGSLCNITPSPTTLTYALSTRGLPAGTYTIYTNGFTNRIGTFTITSTSDTPIVGDPISVPVTITSVVPHLSATNVNVYAVDISGTLPNLCATLEPGSTVTQSGNTINFNIYASQPGNVSCAQALQPFTLTRDLHAGPVMPSGTYNVTINGQYWATVTK